MPRYLISNLMGLVGAAIGGVLGFYTFGWLVGQGFYGPMIPGALLGLGCSLLARHPSATRGIFCGLAALALGFFSEGWFRPFNADEQLSYFVRNLTSLTPVTHLLIGVGAVIAFWIGGDAGLRGLSDRRGYVYKGPDADAPKLE
jgi:hypothetical protein